MLPKIYLFLFAASSAFAAPTDDSTSKAALEKRCVQPGGKSFAVQYSSTRLSSTGSKLTMDWQSNASGAARIAAIISLAVTAPIPGSGYAGSGIAM
ncbi:hypothetical protein EJ02DRAFT_429205 [Clathrospora elynae]|uniref:Uncharacterized protein n=1 Tax=Clathrospora elynae TaxID=706981 RepID=A0A6A5S5E9_9PLEO|nr:hypothetical protein EJ02DRAFT_429205 [Clathrospora elynae]